MDSDSLLHVELTHYQIRVLTEFQYGHGLPTSLWSSERHLVSEDRPFHPHVHLFCRQSGVGIFQHSHPTSDIPCRMYTLLLMRVTPEALSDRRHWWRRPPNHRSGHCVRHGG